MLGKLKVDEQAPPTYLKIRKKILMFQTDLILNQTFLDLWKKLRLYLNKTRGWTVRLYIFRVFQIKW